MARGSHPGIEMICFLRESGGYGDIICTGAAARAIKMDSPNEKVVSFVPESFVETTGHLAGIDEVVSLGDLGAIQPCRRPRDSAIDVTKYPYLHATLLYPNAHFVDLYCPGFCYENSCDERLEYNRCQLFAMATGASRVLDARPVWETTDQEQELAKDWRRTYTAPDSRLIAVQLRGTCSARSVPVSMRAPLVKALSEYGRVVLFDCVPPGFEIPSDSLECTGRSIPLVAAMLEQCTIAVTVDSFLWHLSAALSVPTVGVFGPTDGEVSGSTYPTHVALDGDSANCPIPCNYNNVKNWNRSCRETGCDRMKVHSVDSIVAKVQEVLRR